MVHVDPFGKLADYAALPKADVVLITHEHGDHLDAEALAAVRRPATRSCRAALRGEGRGRTVLGTATRTRAGREDRGGAGL